MSHPTDPSLPGFDARRFKAMERAGFNRIAARYAGGAHLRAGLAAVLKLDTPVVADVEMICVGLSAPRLAHFGMTTHHYISDPDVIELAHDLGTTRAVQSMRKAHRLGRLRAQQRAAVEVEAFDETGDLP